MLRHLGIAICLIGAFISAAFAKNNLTVVELPVPSLVIYPGDQISREMLHPQKFYEVAVEGMAIVRKRTDLIGKEAKRTLLPGQPIPINGVQEPVIVKRGAPTILIFREDELEIRAMVQPLQSGVVGELVKARNLDSGVSVMGVVQKDGTLLAEGG